MKDIPFRIFCRRKAEAAFVDDSADHALCQRRGCQYLGAAGTCRAAANGDVVRVSAECGDIVTHPSEQGKLIIVAVIAGYMMLIFLGKLRMGKETEDSDAVVKAHINDIPTEKCCRVAGFSRTGAAAVCAAVNPDEYRALFAVTAGSPDIGVETVFTLIAQGSSIRGITTGDTLICGLQAAGAEGQAVADSRPRHGRLGELPAEFTYRGSCVGNSQEGISILDGFAANFTGGSFYYAHKRLLSESIQYPSCHRKCASRNVTVTAPAMIKGRANAW